MLGGEDGDSVVQVDGQMREKRIEEMVVRTLRWDEHQESRLKTSRREVGRDGWYSCIVRLSRAMSR